MTAEEPRRPVRPVWLTATMAALGLVGAPLGIVGVALVLGAAGWSEQASVVAGYFAFLAASIGLSLVRAVRPLGVGMVVGSLALVLMFLLTGGTRSPAG